MTFPDIPERDGTPERDELIAEIIEVRKSLALTAAIARLVEEDGFRL
jgi:hypothetical protein